MIIFRLSAQQYPTNIAPNSANQTEISQVNELGNQIPQAVVPLQQQEANTDASRSLIKSGNVANIQSSRFPQHSLKPGRGSQCPYTKGGALARHRVMPMATGTISGPFGTVEIATHEMDTSEIMKRVNEAFFGTKDGDANDEEDDDSPMRKKIKLDPQETGGGGGDGEEEEEEEEQFVYIPETGEVKSLKSMADVPGINVIPARKIEEHKIIETDKMIETETIVEEDVDESRGYKIINIAPPPKSPSPTKTSKTGKTLYKCSKCNLSFPFGPKLKRHEREHKQQRALEEESTEKVQCDKCKKEFMSLRSLNFHQRLNCTPLHHCDTCSEKFHFRYQLDEHILSKHPEVAEAMFGDIQHGCPFCSESFATDALLTHHKGKTHRGWKKQESSTEEPCQQCGQKFKKMADLAHHVKFLHTPTPCQFCKEMFENRNAMIDHLQECEQAPPGEADKHVKKVRDCDHI